MRYYVKWVDKTVAYMDYDEERDLWGMEILHPHLFNGPCPKVFLTDKQVRWWIEKRLVPAYRSDYRKFAEGYGVNIDEPDSRMKLFFATRGTMCTDLNWVAFSEDESFRVSPLYEFGILEDVPREEWEPYYNPN